MSIRSLESIITAEARRVFNNPRLRVKDLQEWSTAPIQPREGEVVELIRTCNIYVAIKVDCDKRARGVKA